jgi:hypothetical protein
MQPILNDMSLQDWLARRCSKHQSFSAIADELPRRSQHCKGPQQAVMHRKHYSRRVWRTQTTGITPRTDPVEEMSEPVISRITQLLCPHFVPRLKTNYRHGFSTMNTVGDPGNSLGRAGNITGFVRLRFLVQYLIVRLRDTP